MPSRLRGLHDSGDMVAIFGRPIPVLVHELEYYDAIAMQNMASRILRESPTTSSHWCRDRVAQRNAREQHVMSSWSKSELPALSPW